MAAPEVLAEEAAPLVQRDGVPEDRHARVARGEGETLRCPDPADGGDGVPHADEMGAATGGGHGAGGVDAGEGLAELLAGAPVGVGGGGAGAEFVDLPEEADGVGHEVLRAGAQEPEVMEQAGEGAGGVGAAAEPEEEDAVPGPVLLHQEGVGLGEVARDAGAEGEPGQDRRLLADPRPHGGRGQGADAGVVADELLRGGIAVEDLDEADDVGVLGAELVVRAVAADEEISGSGCGVHGGAGSAARVGAAVAHRVARRRDPGLVAAGDRNPRWSGRRDSNSRPPGPKPGALPG